MSTNKSRRKLRSRNYNEHGRNLGFFNAPQTTRRLHLLHAGIGST